MSKLTPDTMEDMTEMKRIINAEKACKDATSDWGKKYWYCLLYTSPSPRDSDSSRMPSSA